MAKFRSQHSQNNRQNKFGLLKLIFLSIVVVSLFYLVYHNFKKAVQTYQDHADDNISLSTHSNGNVPDEFLASVSASNELIRHQFYTLSYSERHEQAEWVAYELNIDQLNSSKQDRFDYFAPDLSIKSRSATHRDYTGSGYTRGHLAPAADMAFDAKAAEECFYMSNISPQLRAFNNGIWRELEENVRDWARKNKRLHIVTGPVLTGDLTQKIGTNRVTVPKLFYKIILDYDLPGQKAIAFLIPNERSERPLEEYACSIDSVEQLTSINFFQSVQDVEKIENLEKTFQLSAWNIDHAKYIIRKSKWNKQE